MVRVGAGVDQELAAAHRQRERKGVGVPMGGDRGVAERSGVDHRANFVGRVEVGAEDVVAALREGLALRQARRLGVERLVLRRGLRAEQPARLVVEPPRLELEVAAAEEHRARGERRAKRRVLIFPMAVLVEAHDVAVVGVAEHRHVAAAVHDGSDEIHHRLDARFVVGGEPFAVGLAGEQAQHLHVEHELLVPHRLLAVDAVGRVLRERFPFENFFGAGHPLAHLAPVRPGDARDEQSRRLADQVVVGRRVRREPVADEMRVLVHRAQPARAEFFVGDRPDELPGDRPVDEAHAGFERARPVRPAAVRAGDEPAIELRGERVEIMPVAGERVGLGQGHELQVPVRLPQVLDVADEVRVAVVEQLAEGERRLDAGLRVAVPARRHAELELAQREHVHPTLGDALGGGEIRRGLDAADFLHRRAMDPRLGRGGEIRRRQRRRPQQARALGVRLRRAQRAVGHLDRRHAAQPVETPPERALQLWRYVRCQISRFSSVHKVSSWFFLTARCSSSRRSSTLPS